jgi:hypothetical protein
MLLATEPKCGHALAGMADEDRLIISACLPDSCDARDAEITDALRRDLDWRYIVRVSIEHSVAPLVYSRLRSLRERFGSIAVPSDVLNDLQQLYDCSQRRNQRILGSTAAIFRKFESCAIDAMVLKDLSLICEVFAEPALRPIGDIDILIRREQYPEVRACLEQLEFAPLPDPDNALTMKYAWGHHFHRRRDDLWLDLQWNILQREWSTEPPENAFNIDEMWTAASSISIDRVHVLRPCVEHMLFHLCLHLEGHRYSELILLVEIAELLDKCNGRIDWNAFVSSVRRHEACRSVHQALVFVGVLLQAPIPPWVLDQLAARTSFSPACLSPLFAPLSRLHMQLDAIRLAAAPPQPLMMQMESTVRCHARAASAVSQEIEQIARGSLAAEPAAFLVRCEPSERFFPDSRLKAFGRITAFILEDDLPGMLANLQQSGYEHQDGGACWRKSVRQLCLEPAAAPELALDYQVTVTRNLKMIAASPEEVASPRTVALRLLRSRFRSRRDGVEKISVQIQFVPVTLEEIAAFQIAEVGRSSRERMFAISNILEECARWPGELDWDRVFFSAHENGLSDVYRRAVNLLNGFLGGRFPVPSQPSATREFTLACARYDHLTTEFSAMLTRSFFRLWAFDSIPGLAGKMRYVLQTLPGGCKGPGVLSGAISSLARAAKSLFQRRDRQPVLAYWVERNLLERLASISGGQ